ncbi:hypothetical protein SAMN05421788_112219 [Filimonas lacunae]|uniref:DUF5689 domain-containing protein n=1 Tax=Filimonas lacunae TaxID=477680 RepID=A0A173MLY4_9BACT|nr:DUF5689 domain-containing protein [Filimonas lacunae]BAV08411.1 hypothetical protein FLA_4447 [Filimonas lacunae]SIT33531.1 hypothetical protein SAMN05421788_112219 [Filimonas lacunae]
MKKFSKQLMQLSALLFALVVIVTACKRTFDEPPYRSGDPDLKITHTIKQFQDLYKGSALTITDDVIIAGVVVGDDASGNIFKYIVIQDSTAGMNVQLDASSLNATYPVGRRVFIKAKGLTLGTYGGMLELGLGVASAGYPARIPQAQIADFLVAGSTENVVNPIELNIADVKNAYQNMLVKLKGVEVAKADLSKAYADTSLVSTAVNISLEDCNGGSIVLRSSSYANFAGSKVKQGKGDIVGIYTFYNTTPQFVIRDTTDVAAMTGTRCDGSTGGTAPSTGTKVDSIRALRNLYVGSDVIASGTITGVVISNISNESSANYRIAQENNQAGILVYTKSANSSLALGTKVQLTLTNADTLTTYNGDLEYKSFTTTNFTTLGTGSVTPRVTTIAAINANRSQWSSTMVTLNNVTIAASTTNGTGTNYTLTDATGSLVTFVRSAANITVTPGTATSVTGYVSIYKPAGVDTTTQLTIRNTADIVMGSTTPPVTTANFTGLYGFGSVTATSGTTDPTAVPTADNMTFGSFTANGVSANPNTSGRFSFTTWATGATNGSNTFTGSLDAAKYYEVTITPASGYKLNFDSLAFTVQRSGTGVRQWAVRSSVDGYASNLAASISNGNANLSVVSTDVFQVDDAISTAQEGSKITFSTGFTNLTGAVTFRFYGFNAEGTGGTFSLNKAAFYGSAAKQ